MKNTDLEKYYKHPKLSSSICDRIKEVIDEDEAYVADELVELSEQILLELASAGISLYLSQSNQKEVFNDFIIELFTSKSHSFNSGPLYRWSAHMVKDLDDSLSKNIKSLFWNESDGDFVLNHDFEKLSELRNAVMHGFFILPAERNREEANHLAKVLEMMIEKNIFEISSNMNYHFLNNNQGLFSFNGDWSISDDKWSLYKDCFDFGKLSSRIQYEISSKYNEDQNALVEKSKLINSIDSKLLDYLNNNEKGAVSYWLNPDEDSSEFYSTIIKNIKNNDAFLPVFQQLETGGVNFTSEFLLNRVVNKLAFHVNENKYSKNNKKALYQLRKKCKVKPVVIIDQIHLSLFNSDHILHLANLFYENNILFVAFGIHHSWMDQFFNLSIKKVTTKSSINEKDWLPVFLNYLRFKGPDNNVADQKSDYSQLYAITSKLISEIKKEKVVVARRFSDKYKYPIEFVHEAFSILNPFFEFNTESFDLDELDNLYNFPKEITEGSRVLFSIGRRDNKLEYQHKILKT